MSTPSKPAGFPLNNLNTLNTAQPRQRSLTGTIIWIALTGICTLSLTLAAVFLYLNPQIPDAESYRHVKLETPLRVFTADAALIAEFGERRRIPIRFDEVPRHFINALLDTEGEIAVHYRIPGMPTTFFIDADGIVRSMGAGLIVEEVLVEELARIGVTYEPEDP